MPPPQAATRSVAAGTRPGHAPGGGLLFITAAEGGTRHTKEQGGDARCVLSPGRVPAAGPPGAGGPQFPPQAGARAVRRPLAPEPLVACPCAA